MDINALRQQTTEKLRDAAPLATFDDYADAQALALRSQPARITGSLDGYTVWRLDGAARTERRWDVLLPAVHAIIGTELTPATQAMVDQQQASMAAGLATYGLALDEGTAFVLLASNVATASQILHAVTRDLLTFQAASMVLAIVRGNLAALVGYAPKDTNR